MGDLILLLNSLVSKINNLLDIVFKNRDQIKVYYLKILKIYLNRYWMIKLIKNITMHYLIILSRISHKSLI
jgi:hypothetical protein